MPLEAVFKEVRLEERQAEEVFTKFCESSPSLGIEGVPPWTSGVPAAGADQTLAQSQLLPPAPLLQAGLEGGVGTHRWTAQRVWGGSLSRRSSSRPHALWCYLTLAKQLVKVI